MRRTTLALLALAALALLAGCYGGQNFSADNSPHYEQGLVDKALAKDPKDRFADVAAFVAALESNATRNGATAAAPPVAPPISF